MKLYHFWLYFQVIQRMPLTDSTKLKDKMEQENDDGSVALEMNLTVATQLG